MTPRRRRLRSIPIQVYLTADEHEALQQIAELRQCTIAELVRRWIGKARPRAAAPKATNTTTITDPRQLTIAPR